MISRREKRREFLLHMIFGEEARPVPPGLCETFDREFRVALQTLTQREQEVIRLHHGLNDEDRVYSLEEIGRLFRMTRYRVGAIEKRGFQKLHSPATQEQLRGFFVPISIGS